MKRADYSKGDYRVVAERLRPASVDLVAWCAPRAGDVVVDVGAGTGNAAAEAAGRGARVVAVDITVEQLALGRREWTAPPVSWVAGDALALPLASGCADLAVSVFAAIYADPAERAVAELARVCRAGGTIALTAWPEGTVQAANSEALGAALGLPARGRAHIDAWGDEERTAALLSAVADDVAVRRGTLRARYPSIDAWWEQVSTTAPPVITAREQLDAAAFDALGEQLRANVLATAEQDGDAIVMVEQYLVARGRVRG